MLFVIKNSWFQVPTNANLAAGVYIQAFWKQVASWSTFKSCGVSPVLFMSSRLRYLLRMCSTWLKTFSTTYIVGNVSSNISFVFSKMFLKTLTAADPKSDYPCEWNIARVPLFLWMSMTRSHGVIAFAYAS